jgi:hypothetical protein
MGCFGEMHDGRVLAGRQAATSNQIGVKVPGEGLDDPHECTPKRFLRRSERSEAGHGLRITCMVKELQEEDPSTRRNQTARAGHRTADRRSWLSEYTCLPTQGVSLTVNLSSESESPGVRTRRVGSARVNYKAGVPIAETEVRSVRVSPDTEGRRERSHEEILAWPVPLNAVPDLGALLAGNAGTESSKAYFIQPGLRP